MRNYQIFMTTAYYIMFIAILSVPLLALIAPVSQTILGAPTGENIYQLFSHICHQYPTRSLWILDRPFALCSRCTFGYLGVAFMFFCYTQIDLKYSKRFLIGCLLLSFGVADGLIQLLTTYESVNTIRAITGFAGGSGIVLIFFPRLKFAKQIFNQGIN